MLLTEVNSAKPKVIETSLQTFVCEVVPIQHVLPCTVHRDEA